MRDSFPNPGNLNEVRFNKVVSYSGSTSPAGGYYLTDITAANQQARAGDSGGPLIHDGSLAGVVSGIAASDNSWTTTDGVRYHGDSRE